jgi:hypothetical protein
MSWIITGTQKNNWTPADIDTALWLDAADASTIIESGDAVSQWNDKSGNSNHVSQATPSKRPTYSAGEVSFDGTDDMLVAASPVFSDDFSGAFTLFSVSTLVGDAGYLYGSVDADGTGFYQGGSTNIGLADTLSGATVNLKNHNISGKGIVGVVYNNQVVDYSFNGTVVSANYAYTFGTPTINFTIGNRLNGTSSATYWQGKHHEIILVNTALSASDRQKLEGYLAHEWALTANLPADHPYKTAVPVP